MDSDVQGVVNIGRRRDKTGIFLKILVFLVIPLLIIFVTISIYLIVSNQDVKETSLLEVVVDNQISPWEYSEYSVSPPDPNMTDLVAKYNSVHTAIQNRDYELFKSVASTERIWHVENPKRLINESVTGETVFETLLPRGEENFVRYSPFSILFKAPNAQDISPVRVQKKDPSTRQNFVLIDRDTGETTKVNAPVWSNTFEVVFEVSGELAQGGNGYVSFVWDQGDWKYNGEYWDLPDRENTFVVGNSSLSPVNTFSVDSTGLCTPQTLEINAGDSVSWEGVLGMVFSVDPSTDYWQSGFLNYDEFIKEFTLPGEYTYLILQIPNEPQSAKECKIIVN